MDPSQIPFIPPIYPLFYPGIFNTEREGNDYLDSLDSDTREYVVNHTDEFSSREELLACVNRLRGEK